MAKLKDKIKFACKLITDPGTRFYYNSMHGKYHDMDDAEYLKKMFKIRLGRELDLDNPTRLSEKLQWLKLYNRKPEYTAMVDKYDAKKYAAERIGEDHVLPALGVWDRAEDVDITDLPDSFVLKCTHDSGGFVICTDKSSFDLESAKATLGARFDRNYFWGDREWPYKNVKPRIMAEPYIPSLGHPDSKEYKVTCFDGKVAFVTVCQGPAHQELWKRTNDHYDRDFKTMPWYAYYKNSENILTEKPDFWDELIEMSEKLSADIPYLRCDFYVHEGKVYFGEVTFFTWGGFLVFTPDEWDKKLGDMLTLPEKTV